MSEIEDQSEKITDTTFNSNGQSEKTTKQLIYGLFTREFIPKYSVLGTYIGKYELGGEIKNPKFVPKAEVYIDPITGEKIIKSDSTDYSFQGKRDSINAQFYGNFLRFANHQDIPNCFISTFFMPKSQIFKNFKNSKNHNNNHAIKSSSTHYKKLPKYIETISFFASRDIYPGEEIFINYGPNYWGSREKYGNSQNKIEKRRQLSVEQFDQELSFLQGKVDFLTRFVYDLSKRLENVEGVEWTY